MIRQPDSGPAERAEPARRRIWLAPAVAVGLLSAGFLQTTQSVRARWDWETPVTEADLTAHWEIEVDGVVQPCTPATVTLRTGECGPVPVPLRARKLRLRGVRADGVVGPWSDTYTIGVSKTGGFEIITHEPKPLPPGLQPPAPRPPQPPASRPPSPPVPPSTSGRLEPSPASVSFTLRADATQPPEPQSVAVAAPPGLEWESHDSMPGIDISPQTDCPFNGRDGVRCTGSATLVLTPSAAILDLPAGSHRYEVRLSAPGRANVVLRVTVTVTR